MAISEFNIHGNYIYAVGFVTKNREQIFLCHECARLMTKCIISGWSLKQYWLLAFSVMPEHVHILLKPREKEMIECVRQLKGVSAKMINKNMKRSGKFWESDYFARPIEYLRLIENEIEYKGP